MLSRRQFLRCAGACAAVAVISKCVGAGAYFPDPIPTPLELIVKDALAHISKEEFSTAEKLLEKHDANYRIDAGYHALLGIAQAGNESYFKADQTFRSLVCRFEQNPETIFTVRDRLMPLFQTEPYQKLRQKLRDAATLRFPIDLSDLNAVDGFLCLAEQKFSSAYCAFRLVLPKYPHKKGQYRELMTVLVEHSRRAGDEISRKGYTLVRHLFE